MGLSGGQQQRLCIARAIATDPEVLLMDEPCSALDPIATARIEDLMQEIKDQFTIVIVTHNMQQAARVSDRTAFFTTEVNPESDTRTGSARRVRQHRQDVLEPVRRAHRELRHRSLRVTMPLRPMEPGGEPLRHGFHDELDQLRLQVELMGVRVDENLERMRRVLHDGRSEPRASGLHAPTTRSTR